MEGNWQPVRCNFSSRISPTSVPWCAIYRPGLKNRITVILIHGTKVSIWKLKPDQTIDTVEKLNRNVVRTMSEVIKKESVVGSCGLFGWVNLARELAENIQGNRSGVHSMKSFKLVSDCCATSVSNVYDNPDLVGIELAGVLKTLSRLPQRALSGPGYGENARTS